MGLVPKQVKLVNQVMELVNQLLRVCGECALSVHGNLNVKKCHIREILFLLTTGLSWGFNRPMHLVG